MSISARTLRFASCTLAALTVAACGGGGGDDGTQLLTPSITVAASPSAVTVQQGGTGTIAITSTRANLSGSIAVSVDGLPSGVSATSTPAQLDASTTSATINVAVASSVAVGTYAATVRASGGGVSATTTYSLTVVAPPDFSLAAAPTTVTVSSAATGTSAITIARTGAFAGAVSFAMQSAQAGITGVFAPASTTDNSTSLTISATSAVAVGTYPVTITGNGVGIGDRTVAVSVNVVAAPSFSLSAAPATLSINAGSNATSTVTITRVGGFAGEVTLALTSAQAGITGTFAPPATTGASTVATLNVAASVPVGTYTATITGTSPDQTSRTATLSITVGAQPKIAIALTSTALTIANTNEASATANITRTNFTGGVTFAATGQPNGMTVSFNQSPTTTNSSVATVNVGAAVAAGAYPLTITASGTGVASVTSTLTVTVPAPVFVDELFCSNFVPTWFAYQDGEGTWTSVTSTTNGANTQFRFPIGSAYGAFAIMRPGTYNGVVRYTTTYYYGTREELAALRDTNACSNTAPAGPNRLITLSNYNPTTHFVFVKIGPATYIVGTNGTTNLLGVPIGTHTLFSIRFPKTSPTPDNSFTDRVAIFRDIPQASTPLPSIDYEGASSYATVTSTFTIQNLLGDNASSAVLFNYSGGAQSLSNSALSNATTRTYYGFPADKRVNGEYDEISVSASDPAGTTFINSRQTRVVGTTALQNFVVPLGAKIAPTTLTTVTTGGYARPRFQLTVPTDYNRTVTLRVGAELPNGNFEGTAHVLVLMGGYRAIRMPGTGVDITAPDLSGAAGFPVAAVMPRGACSLNVGVEGWTGGVFLDNAPGRVFKRADTLQKFDF